jgi:hypothetical protein
VVPRIKLNTLTAPPPCPNTLIEPKARELWCEMCQILTDSGRLAAEDIQTLELAFLSLQNAIRLQRALNEIDPIDEANKYKTISGTLRAEASFYSDIMLRFGVTPRGRESIAATLAKAQSGQQKSLAEKMMEGDGEGTD